MPRILAHVNSASYEVVRLDSPSIVDFVLFSIYLLGLSVFQCTTKIIKKPLESNWCGDLLLTGLWYEKLLIELIRGQMTTSHSAGLMSVICSMARLRIKVPDNFKCLVSVDFRSAKRDWQIEGGREVRKEKSSKFDSAQI